MREHDRFVRRTVDGERVPRVRPDTGGKDDALLGRTSEEVPTFRRPSIEPVRIVEGAAAQPEHARKPLEVEIESRSALAAEVHGDPHPATVRAMVVGLSGGAGEHDGV